MSSSEARAATSPAGTRDAACDYCHLPVGAAPLDDGTPVYCCLGCRIAAEIAGQGGPKGAIHWTLARLGLAIFLSLNVMVFTMALWNQELHGADGAAAAPLALSLANLFRYLALVLSLPVLFLLGGPMLEAALAAGRRGVMMTDLLIVLGVAAAYLYSAISVFRGSGHVYFEVGCLVLVMVTLGRWLESSGKLKTTEALDALETLLPKQVRRIDGDRQEQLVPLADLRVGDRLRVLAGERLATDGRLVSGTSSFDQQLLSGESHPVVKQPGDEVLGGSLNLEGDLEIEVTTPPEQSSLARIVELVREARLKKGHYERIADRVARWFLPAVIAVAIGAFAVHTQRSGVDHGVLAALAVLLIACPCALGLATPMAVWTALGTASRAGVLFRDGEALERLATIRAVRFDKTGTLTTGVSQVREFVVADPTIHDEVLRRAALLAGASTHVYSQAIAEFARAEMAPRTNHCGEPARPVVSTSPGEGLSAQFTPGEPAVRLGSVRWLERSGLRLDARLSQAVAHALARGESLSAIGWDGRVQALFVFSETLREGAALALGDCAAAGYDVAVLTGDHAARGRAIADALHVPVQAELLPADKVAALADARRRFGHVAMVGDGVNDAPALAASDLGIAMGSGVDVSRESAGVCLLANDVATVPWGLALARRTRRTILQNLFWAFSYNTVGIVLAASGWLNPTLAAGAMVASSFMVVSNSLRLSRIELPHGEPLAAGVVSHVEGASDSAPRELATATAS